MKFRSFAAAALTAAVSLSMTAPALAAESADARLTQVTQQVKATLGVGDEYTKFYGEPNETYLGTKWELNWSGDDGELSVSATDEGKVVSMSKRRAPREDRDNNYGPSFPSMTRDEAKVLADEFLGRVLTPGETPAYDDSWDTSASLDVTEYGFGGTVALGGLSTPMTFRLWVSVEDRAVTNFWRDDQSSYVGDPAPATTVTTVDAARAQLAGTLDLELIYVRDNGSDTAVLRYVPRATDDFYVDAATGTLVNLTELRAKLFERGGSANKFMSMGGAMNEAAADAAAPEAVPTLSPAELEGVAKLEGVLTKEELDAKVRAWTALGLSGFELTGASFTVERIEDYGKYQPMPVAENTAGTGDEAEAVIARLTYNKRMGDSIARRTVTLDAKTGELQSMYGYDPYEDKAVRQNEKAAQAKAEEFLKALWGDQFAKTACYDSAAADKISGAHRFTFAQKVNDYFFPENTLSVRVSARDGSIMGFDRGFDDTVKFDSAEGLVSLDTAKTAWAGSYPVELRYIAVPVKLDMMGPEVKPFLNAGYSYYNALKPGYELGDQKGWYLGVDAKTGELVKEPETTAAKLTYSDIKGHWAETALTELAQYDVGWFEGKADPNGQLTQVAYVALLASSDGYRYVPGDEGSADQLYDYAVRRGLLTKAERNDVKVLTRGEMVKMMLDSLGYKAVANLKDIFKCAYADAAAIPDELMGYAALAQGLGLVKGDGQGNFAAGRASTRAEAAVMLWQYMKR